MTPKAAPWISNVTQPAGGGAQARIAQHLNAGAPTSAGLHATLTLNKKTSGETGLFPDKMNFDPVHPAENVLVWTKYRTAEFAEHPVSRKPVGGGAQARIAQHLSAGALTSAGLPATLSLNKKNVR